MYKVIYYKTKLGNVPAFEFVNKLPIKAQAKIRKQILILSYEGSNLKRPYADYLRDGIYELRVKFSSGNLRVFYFFFERQYIILTNGFIKKTASVPKNEIETAIKFKFEFESRVRK